MDLRTTAIAVLLLFLASFISPVVPLNVTQQVPAVFAFGDSTIDPGNNDGQATLFRGDHAPYGGDFPGHISTGRMSNGKLLTDFLVSILGIKDVLPAYLDPTITDRDLITGVSFASAGSGLDDLSANLSNTLHMSTQLDYFEEALGRIRRTVGAKEANRIVGDALFAVGSGTNDLLFNFYGLRTRRAHYSLSGYHDYLLQNLESVIQRLYKNGARRITVSGLPPIGCLPFQVTAGSFIPSPHMLQRVCVSQQNHDSQAYNTKLQALILRLQATLTESRIAYIDIYNPMIDMIIHPAKYGFVQTLQGCCGTGLVEMGALCNEITPTCPDPNRYLFWDSVHPTEAAYRILANLFTRTALPPILN